VCACSDKRTSEQDGVLLFYYGDLHGCSRWLVSEVKIVAHGLRLSHKMSLFIYLFIMKFVQLGTQD